MYSSLLWNYRAGFAYSIEELDGNAPLAQADRTDPKADHQHGDDPNKQPRFFSKERFLKGCDRDTRVLHAALVSFFAIVSTTDLHFQDYLSQFVNSQMFTQFITDRLTRSPREYEVLFFDEIIKLKLNRSKLKLLKEDTPFLDVSVLSLHISYGLLYSNTGAFQDDSFAVTQTVWANAPRSLPDTDPNGKYFRLQHRTPRL
jgi:hypothetical protein